MFQSGFAERMMHWLQLLILRWREWSICWVVGEERYVSLHFLGAEHYASK